MIGNVAQLVERWVRMQLAPQQVAQLHGLCPNGRRFRLMPASATDHDVGGQLISRPASAQASRGLRLLPKQHQIAWTDFSGDNGGMMSPNSCASRALVAVVVSMTAGCATYRTSSNIESKPQATATPGVQVLLAEDSLPARRCTELGPIEVSVKKLTFFDKDPTREQANEALIEKARSIGANAVIKITYTSGVGLMTWGYVDANGIGVKLTE